MGVADDVAVGVDAEEGGGEDEQLGDEHQHR